MTTVQNTKPLNSILRLTNFMQLKLKIIIIYIFISNRIVQALPNLRSDVYLVE